MWTVHKAKEMPGAFIGVHELPGDGGQIQSIHQIVVDIEEHYVVEALLGHGRSQVGLMHQTAERDLSLVAVATGIVREILTSLNCLPHQGV